MSTNTFLTHEEFRRELKSTFGLEYSIYKEKHGYDMVEYTDGTSGTVAGAFAGHSHNCRVPHFEYLGWVYAYINGEWFIAPDGVSGWRQCSEPPFIKPYTASRSLW